MPELPEVQTTVNGLQSLINKEITNIELYSIKLRYLIPKKIKKITKNNKILQIYRIGKYIILNLSNNYSIIFHLGMSGRLIISNKNKYKFAKHDHIVFFLNNYKILSFNDQRKFGFVDIVISKEIKKTKYILKLGLDPFDDNFTHKYLLDKIKNSIVPIKQILLNQSIIAGIGNIYANEILFEAKISPFIPGSLLSIAEIRKLINVSKKVLIRAINLKGTSIRNYTTTEGTLGNFQNKFKVYNKENKKILGFRIKRAVQYGRSTYYCPEIQKILSKKL